MTEQPLDPGANWCPDCGLPRGVCDCEDCISYSVAIARQLEIRDRLLAEIDDGLLNEALWSKWEDEPNDRPENQFSRRN